MAVYYIFSTPCSLCNIFCLYLFPTYILYIDRNSITVCIINNKNKNKDNQEVSKYIHIDVGVCIAESS